MVWCHTICVGIEDIDSIGAWVCADCRLLPNHANLLERQIKTLLETTSQIYTIVTSLLEKKNDTEFDHLYSRITDLSNQIKQTDQSSTSSISEIKQDVTHLRTEIDKKTNVLLSQTKTVCDKLKSTTDLVRNTTDYNTAKMQILPGPPSRQMYKATPAICRFWMPK